MTYGIPHTVRGWGDDIVTTVTMPPGPEFDEYTAVVRGTEPGPVILVPTVALTPVDTTPAEPEPGAYELKHPRHSVPFIALRHCNAWVVDGGWFDSWSEFWREYGGPEVTIRRLVPEPEPVELPWDPNPLDVNDLGKTRTSVRVQGYYVQDENVVGRVGNVVTMLPDEAEEKAAALLTAARAAREVKP